MKATFLVCCLSAVLVFDGFGCATSRTGTATRRPAVQNTESLSGWEEFWGGVLAILTLGGALGGYDYARENSARQSW